MSEWVDQIERLLHAVSKHGDLVAEAFSGTVELGDRQRNQRIDALSNLKALKSQEEGVYRLNPRLRDFISDYLVSYRAFQTLTRLAGAIHQARALWRELRAARELGEESDWEHLYVSFDDLVADISYSIERNLSLLHSLLSTQYGDVANLKAKLRQNKYYINEISEALNEMTQVHELFNGIESEALGAGMLVVRSMVKRRLTSRLLMWTSQIKDAQATISRSLFRARRLEERVRKLSRVSHWLRQNRSSPGFEVALSNAPDSLFRADPIPVKSHIDVRGASEGEKAALLEAIRRMPPRNMPRPVPERLPPLPVLEEQLAVEYEEPEPHEAMLEALLAELHRKSVAIGLRNWKEQKPMLDYLSDEEWLLFASIQLQSEGVHLTFVLNSASGIQTPNELSDDILASVAS
ncbi:hypothetical protein [Paraburkholderia sp.]|uniref:hypothetical protein n=1 Tax=Paraburkholderia sp. TaxID=1926495 RepID=UPI003C7E18C8